MRLALVIVAALLLSGCGKKSIPTPPGPADQVTYPKSYPTY